MNYIGLTTLSWAAKRGNVTVVDMLLEMRADVVDSHGATCFSLSPSEGHAEIVSTLLDHGADWSALDNSRLDA